MSFLSDKINGLLEEKKSVVNKTPFQPPTVYPPSINKTPFQPPNVPSLTQGKKTLSNKLRDFLPSGILDEPFGYSRGEREALQTLPNMQNIGGEIQTKGVLGFVYQDLFKPRTAKIEDRYNKLVSGGVDSERALKVASQEVDKQDITSLAQKMSRAKVSGQPFSELLLTQQEQKLMKNISLVEKVFASLDALDFVSFGTISASADLAKRIAKTDDFLKIKNIFTKEFKAIDPKQAEISAKILAKVNDPKDVKSILDEINFRINKVNDAVSSTYNPRSVVEYKGTPVLDHKVVQIVNGDDATFFRIPLRDEQKIIDLVDNNRRALNQPEAIAGGGLYGDKIHITSTSPTSMSGRGFQDGGIIRYDDVKNIVNTTIGTKVVPIRGADGKFLGSIPRVLGSDVPNKQGGFISLRGETQKPLSTKNVSVSSLNDTTKNVSKQPYEVVIGGDVYDGTAIIRDGKVVGGIAVEENVALEIPEILGIEIKPKYRRLGIGRDEVNNLLDKNPKIYVRSTKQAKPFWESFGATFPEKADENSGLWNGFITKNSKYQKESSQLAGQRESLLSQTESKQGMGVSDSYAKPIIDRELNKPQLSTVDLDKTPPSISNRTVNNDWRGTFQLPEETKLQATRRVVEDFNIRLKVLNDKIEDVAGKRIDENLDLWAQKDMLPRQQSDLLRRIRDEKIDFVKRMVADDIPVEGLDEYMHAKHAIERNAKMNANRAERNLEPIDGLSGMTDAEAKEILSRDNSKFKPYANEVQKMIDDSLNFEVEAGLLKQSDADIIRGTYKNYVPLYRDIGEDTLGIGAGIDIRGKEIKRAKGSEKRVTSPLGNAFFQKEKAHIRALKNDIGKTIINLTEQHEFTKDIFEIEAQKFAPRFNADGELQFLDPRTKLGDNVIGAKIEGKQYFITIKDQKLAQALKNVNIARVPIAMQYLRSMLGVWSSFKTRLRPEFLVTNFQRDLGEALVNLNIEKTALKDKGKFLRAKIVKDIFPSQRSVWKYLRGGKNSDIDEFFKLGGDAGHFWLEPVKEAEISLRKLEKQLQNNGIEKIKNPIRKAGQLVDDLNSMVELGVRYSTYKNLVSVGFSKQKAIQSAADLTLNFARQGEWSPVLKSFYGFINPTIQGSSKVLRTITGKGATRRVVQAITALATLGFAVRTISMMIDPEGDEQINDWNKNHKLTFAIGDGKTVTLWNMPYGYTSIYAMGSNIAEVVNGKKTISEALNNTISTTVDGFSPFGTSLNDLIPTLAKPIFEIQQNEGWYGGNIKPDQVFTNTPKPNSSTYFKNTSETAKFITSFLNNITGGDENTSGVIDISPNDLEYMYDQYLGGPFEFVTSSLEAGGQISQGEFDPNKTPFVRQVYRENTASTWSYGVIYDTLEQAYKGKLSPLEKDRFYRAVQTGVDEKIFEQDRADDFIKDFIKAQYKISGPITDESTIAKLSKIPKEDQTKLINTYATSTRDRLNKSLNTGSLTDKINNKINGGSSLSDKIKNQINSK